MVTTFVGGLRSVDVHGDDYRRRVDDIDGLADREIRSTADMSNRLLDRPTRAMRGLGQGDAPIAKSLLDLRRSVEELNPARHDLTQGGPRSSSECPLRRPGARLLRQVPEIAEPHRGHRRRPSRGWL